METNMEREREREKRAYLTEVDFCHGRWCRFLEILNFGFFDIENEVIKR